MGLALVASMQYPILLPTALLAYTFGLRHAVDADHIAAIDNTTRKLMQDGQRPVGVGLFFSLGHSTIVVALSVADRLCGRPRQRHPGAPRVGGLIGTSVSAIFLLVIGFINLVVLIDIYRMFRRVSAGRRVRRAVARGLPPQPRASWPGCCGRRSGSSARAGTCTRSGVLFGLGFDTASEVALLGLAATSGANHCRSTSS